MSFSERISPLIGRMAIAWLFLSEAWTIIHSWDGTITLMQMKHIELAPPLLVLALAVMILGSISIAIGFHARTGAVLLFGFTIAVSLVMHDYWKLTQDADRAADYEIFIRNMAIAGALLLIVGIGPGPIAVDSIGKGKKR